MRQEEAQERALWVGVAVLVGALLALVSCVGVQAPGAQLAVQPGPCGVVYRLEASAGVPLQIPVGEVVVEVEAQGGAVVTVRPACEAPAAAQEDIK